MYKYITVKKVQKPSLIIHCVQAPEDGEMVNAQLLETENSLLLIDTLQLKPHADELRQYIESIGKPLDRVIITHAHPDHWLGAASFGDQAIYAFEEVIKTLNQTAGYLVGYHRSLHPDSPQVIPDNIVLPELTLKEGDLDFDGITLRMVKVLETECPVNLVVEIPSERIIIAQDLVYNNAYAYFGERTSQGEYSFDNWIKVLQQYQAKNYTDVLPGHGDPADAGVLQSMINYLEFVKDKVNDGLRGERLSQEIKNQFPEYGLPLTLIMSNFMLFGIK